jgi:hypothetical protein
MFSSRAQRRALACASAVTAFLALPGVAGASPAREAGTPAAEQRHSVAADEWSDTWGEIGTGAAVVLGLGIAAAAGRIRGARSAERLPSDVVRARITQR